MCSASSFMQTFPPSREVSTSMLLWPLRLLSVPGFKYFYLIIGWPQKKRSPSIRDRKTVRSETLDLRLEKEKGRRGNSFFLSRTYRDTAVTTEDILHM